MAEKKTGITIFVRNATDKGLDAANKSVKTFGNSLAGVGKVGMGAFKAVGAGAIALNQGLELVKKGVALFRETLGAALMKSLEFRSVNDRQAQDLRKFQRQIELVGARIGDLLLPIINAIGDAMGPVLDSFMQWLDVNRELVGGKLISWLTSAADGLVKGIAYGAVLAVRGLESLKQGAMAAASFAMKARAAFIGMTDAAEGQRILNNVVKLEKAMKDSSAEAEALEDKIAGFQYTALGVIDNVRTAGFERLSKSIKGGTKNAEEMAKAVEKIRAEVAAWEEQQASLDSFLANAEAELHAEGMRRLEERKAAVSAFSSERIKQIENQAALEETLAKQRDAREQEQNQATLDSYAKIKDTAMEIANGAAQALGQAFGAILSGAENLSDQLKQIGTQLLKMAASSILKLMLTSFIGGPGAGIGASFLGGLFANQGAWVPVRKFASGGHVSGGAPGVDSVPAMLTPGERVLSTDEVRALRKLQSEGLAGGGGGGVTQVINISNAIPQTRHQIDRNVAEAVAPSLGRNARRVVGNGINKRTSGRRGAGSPSPLGVTRAEH